VNEGIEFQVESCLVKARGVRAYRDVISSPPPFLDNHNNNKDSNSNKNNNQLVPTPVYESKRRWFEIKI
jgi:hypothetical protein